MGHQKVRIGNNKFSKKMVARTLQFVLDVIDLSRSLPNTPEARFVRFQSTKAGTSAGANYLEANRLRSKREFAHKIKICETEASETEFWLIANKTKKWGDRDKAGYLPDEISELLAIYIN
jgi:four helix bundle protein